MLAAKWTIPLVLTLTSVVTAVGAAAKTAGETDLMRFRDTPLGRLVTGNIGRLLVLRSEANVTPEQRAKIRETVKNHKAEIGNVVKDLIAKRRALREAVQNDKPDESAIQKAGDDLGHSIGKAAVLASKVRGELKPTFTAQQIELFQKYLKERDGSVDRWVQESFGS